MRLIDYFDRAAARYPQRRFAIHNEATITHAQAKERSIRAMRVLRSRGIQPGHKVAVWSANSINACTWILGILRADCVWVTLGSGGNASDIARAIDGVAVDALIYSESNAGKIDEIFKTSPSLRATICIDDELDQTCLSEVTWGDSCRAESPSERDPIVTIFSSGGTTGEPKGVALRERAWQFLVLSSAINLNHDRPVKLVVTPIFQTAGGVHFLADLVKGCTHVLMDRFDPGAVLDAIERYRITFLFLPPAALAILLLDPTVRKRDYSSLQYLVYGGAPSATARIAQAMEVFGPVLLTGFGLTETGGPVTCFLPEEHRRAIVDGRYDRLSSCGRETLTSRVEIMDPDGRLVSAGQEGEIVVRSAHMMCGYYSKHTELPETTDFASDGGWYRTGDIGTKDEEGYLYVVDRKRDMIISGGHNIFPRQIERFIEEQPGVHACAVVGIPDDIMGEVCHAVVEPVPGATVDTRALIALCRKNLSPMKTPASIEVWNELPKSSVGKVLRRQVREQYWIGRKRRV